MMIYNSVRAGFYGEIYDFTCAVERDYRLFYIVPAVYLNTVGIPVLACAEKLSKIAVQLDGLHFEIPKSILTFFAIPSPVSP